MNTTVTATNMSVEAKATKNLLISQTSGSAGFAGTQDMSAALSTCIPVSTVGGNTATPAFYKIKVADAAMTQDNAARVESTMESATANTDYFTDTVWVKCVGSDATNLIATISTTSGADKALDPSLRVMLVVNANTFIYSPIAGSGYLTSGQAIASVNGSEKGVLGSITTAATSGTTVNLASLTADTAYQIDIYIWYEGEDPACKATNTADLAATTFTISFSVT